MDRAQATKLLSPLPRIFLLQEGAANHREPPSEDLGDCGAGVETYVGGGEEPVGGRGEEGEGGASEDVPGLRVLAFAGHAAKFEEEDEEGV